MFDMYMTKRMSCRFGKSVTTVDCVRQPRSVFEIVAVYVYEKKIRVILFIVLLVFTVNRIVISVCSENGILSNLFTYIYFNSRRRISFLPRKERQGDKGRWSYSGNPLVTGNSPDFSDL